MSEGPSEKHKKNLLKRRSIFMTKTPNSYDTVIPDSSSCEPQTSTITQTYVFEYVADPFFMSQTHASSTHFGFPMMLEAVFRYNEILLKILEKPSKPFFQYNTNDVLEWIGNSEEIDLINWITSKKITGEKLYKIPHYKLMKRLHSKEKVNMFIKKIKDCVDSTCFAWKLLEFKCIDDTIIRDMYQFHNSYYSECVTPLKSFDIRHGIAISFMVIVNFFTSSPAMITENHVKEIRGLQINENPFDRLTFLDDTKNIVYRMCNFIKTMSTTPTSIFYYFKDFFIDKMFTLLAPNVDINQFKVLLKYVQYDSPYDFSYETKFSYGGEIMLCNYDDVLFSQFELSSVTHLKYTDKKNWVDGSLCVSNYRLIWKPRSRTFFNEHPQCVCFHQIPLKSIYNIFLYDEIRSNTKFYCIQILSYTSQTLTLIFENLNESESLMNLINVKSNNDFVIDDFDMFLNQTIFSGIAQQRMKRYQVDDRFKCDSLNIGGNIYEEAIVFDGTYLSPPDNESNTKIPILVITNIHGGTIYRWRIFKYMEVSSEDTSTYFSSGVIKKIFMLPTLRQLEEHFKKYYEAIRNFNITRIDEIFQSISFINEFVTPLLNQLHSTINLYNEGHCFLFTTIEGGSEVVFATALFLLMTDSYYRTFEGFIELIHSEFIASNYLTFVVKEELHCYYLLIFIHVVSCFLHSCSSGFEFNQHFLNFISYHLFSGRFSTFNVCNNPTQSLYSHFFQYKNEYISTGYDENAFDFYSLWPDRIYIYPPTQMIDFINYTEDNSILFRTSHKQYLNAKESNLTTFPSHILQQFDVEYLRKLNLNNNYIRTLPSTLTQITQLQELRIANNNIDFIPDWIISNLTLLTSLDISEKPDTLEYKKFPSLDFLVNLKYVDISNRKFTFDDQLPINIKTLIANGSFEVFPEQLIKLKKLVSLDISSNPLINLNSNFNVFKLSQLTTLKMSSCNKESIPNAISAFSNLAVLDLSHNKLSALPLDLFRCSKLVSLNISHNTLNYLSTLYTTLVNLTELHIGGNNFINVPVLHQQFPSLSPLQKNIYITPLHILSNSKGIEQFRKYFAEFKFSKYEPIRVFDTPPQFDDIKNYHFRTIYHTFDQRHGFFPCETDGYCLVLFPPNVNLTVTH
ncbi:Serine-threonine protein kinase [Entamoeba marina]